MCADWRTHHSLCAEVKGQLYRASFLLRPLRGFWKLGLGCQPRVASTFTCGATLLVFPRCVLGHGPSLDLTDSPRLPGSGPGIQLSSVPQGWNDGCLLPRLACYVR